MLIYFPVSNMYNDIIVDEFNTTPYAFLDKYELLNQNNWYINASFIDGPLRDDLKYFIATQYPLSNTIGKFYQMCFTHGSKLIVMLSSFDEDGRKKSDKYIPNSIGMANTFTINDDAIIQVILRKEQWIIKGCLIKRELEIKTNDEFRLINHIQMVNWPDFLIPNEELGYETIDNLIQLIIEYREMNENSPIVIHCSAGIGRTGTFITLFNIVKCLRLYKTIIAPIDLLSRPKPFISVFNMVRMLREQRLGMVASVEQYSYIYQFICKWITINMELIE